MIKVTPRVPVLGMQMAVFSFCPHLVVPLCPLLLRTSVRLKRGDPSDPILTSSPLEIPYLQTQSYSEALGG